jgi:methylenetetrahydrofolate reductase (NADPH)
MAWPRPAERDVSTEQRSEQRQQANRVLAGFLRQPGYEVIPLSGIEESVLEHVPRDISLTVTASPPKGMRATVDLAERLASHGYRVAPHLSARLIRDGSELAEFLHRLGEAGVRDAFVVAGDVPEPAGPFEGAIDLLRAMAEIGHHFDKVGITGYPESHPIISDEATIQAMYDKVPYADYIISQICFDPKTISGWARWVKRRGVDLPIRVGMPGVVNRQKLMRISTSIGLGESARFLLKQHNWLLKMFMPGGYSPNRLVLGLKPALADPENNLAGFHIYTFNDVGKTEAWRREMLKRVEAAS